MGVMQLQPRPLYGIGTVARLTGIKPDTLRIWERRYQLGASHKSASGRRQYTQADLEHLQLVAALVAAGTRIGEIANSDRRTLEVLLRVQSDTAREPVPAAKPRVLFVGESLCAWLEEHQGCLANVNGLLASASLADLPDDESEQLTGFDEIVVQCDNVGVSTVQALSDLAANNSGSNVLLLHAGGSPRTLASLEEQGVTVAEFPPEPSFLTFHFSRNAVQREAARGSHNLGDLVEVSRKMFSQDELEEFSAMKSASPCECPEHVSRLVHALGEFEEYAADCPVGGWRDATLHACVYAYAGRARWLMEKALSLVADAHQQSLDEEVQTRH